MATFPIQMTTATLSGAIGTIPLSTGRSALGQEQIKLGQVVGQLAIRNYKKQGITEALEAEQKIKTLGREMQTEMEKQWNPDAYDAIRDKYIDMMSDVQVSNGYGRQYHERAMPGVIENVTASAEAIKNKRINDNFQVQFSLSVQEAIETDNLTKVKSLLNQQVQEFGMSPAERDLALNKVEHDASVYQWTATAGTDPDKILGKSWAEMKKMDERLQASDYSRIYGLAEHAKYSMKNQADTEWANFMEQVAYNSKAMSLYDLEKWVRLQPINAEEQEQAIQSAYRNAGIQRQTGSNPYDKTRNKPLLNATIRLIDAGLITTEGELNTIQDSEGGWQFCNNDWMIVRNMVKSKKADSSGMQYSLNSPLAKPYFDKLDDYFYKRDKKGDVDLDKPRHPDSETRWADARFTLDKMLSVTENTKDQTVLWGNDLEIQKQITLLTVGPPKTEEEKLSIARRIMTPTRVTFMERSGRLLSSVSPVASVGATTFLRPKRTKEDDTASNMTPSKKTQTQPTEYQDFSDIPGGVLQIQPMPEPRYGPLVDIAATIEPDTEALFKQTVNDIMDAKGKTEAKKYFDKWIGKFRGGG